MSDPHTQEVQNGSDDQEQNGANNGGPDRNPGEGDGGSSSSEHSGGSDSGADKGKNWLEWTITIAGAALVLFVVGFLIYEWATTTGESADLQVSLGTPTVSDATVEIPVEVKNEGDRVAEAAVVEVCAGPESCAQITFDYVPFKSAVSGTVGLEAPLQAAPTTRVVSFRDP